MKTLKELVIESKCRTGEPDGHTKRGPYWLSPIGDDDNEILIRSFGGDGIGQSSSDMRNYLRLLHYRDGEVRAVVRYHSWHQNYGNNDSYQTVDILSCTTAEDVWTELLSSGHEDRQAASDYWRSKLIAELVKFGMAESLPAPDEA